MFKNKRLLQKGRSLVPKGEERENFSFKLLGDEDLLISQMSKQPRRQKPTLVI